MISFFLYKNTGQFNIKQVHNSSHHLLYATCLENQNKS